MVVIKRKMSLVERSSVGGGNFWGLVQQKGPWKTTRHDIANARASMKQDKVSGGGIGEGGTLHAGNGNYKQVINPVAITGRDAPPKPSSLGMRSIVLKESNHYRKKAVAGFLPQYDTLGERSATEVGGHKAGGTGAGVIKSELDYEMMPSTPLEVSSAPFLTEHRLEEEQVKEEEGIRMVPIHTFDKKGVVRTPKQKVTMKPYERVQPKEINKNVEKARALMAKREQEKVFAKPSGLPKRQAETQGGKGKKANTKNTPSITYIKPIKRKTETGGEGPRKKGNTADKPVFNPLKRKADTGGVGARKKTKSKLQISTTGLPPPVQRFQGGAGRREDFSLPKKNDKLPFPTARQVSRQLQIARAA
jgi:hypothetical protein